MTSSCDTSVLLLRICVSSSRVGILGESHDIRSISSMLLTLSSSAMGMAAIGIALYKYVMKFSPRNCNYFNRDRFVLSNGMLTPFYSKPALH